MSNKTGMTKNAGSRYEFLHKRLDEAEKTIRSQRGEIKELKEKLEACGKPVPVTVVITSPTASTADEMDRDGYALPAITVSD